MPGGEYDVLFGLEAGRQIVVGLGLGRFQEHMPRARIGICPSQAPQALGKYMA